MMDYNPVRCGFLKVCVFSPKILFLMFFVYVFFSLASLTNITKISLEYMHVIFRQLKHRGIKKWVFRETITALWALLAMVLSMTVFGFDSGSPDYLFSSGQYQCTIFCVCSVLSVFRALVLELNLCFERVLNTMVQSIDKEN